MKAGVSLLCVTVLVVGIFVPNSVVRVFAASNSASPITLYYHNDTANPLIAGFTQATTILNSSAIWSSSPQLWPPSGGRFTFLFYLTPNLAGDVSINGTIALHPWASGTTGGGSPAASFGLTIYEVSSAGFIWSASSSGPGTVTIASTPTDVNKLPQNAAKQLVYQVPAHTFSKGHSIAVAVDAQPSGSTVLSFYFDNSATPSYVIINSADHASVSSTWYTDEFGNPAAAFIARDLGVLTVNTLVTDPFGVYDVALPSPGNRDPNIRLDLVAPDGVVILANASMISVTGSPAAWNGTLAYTLRIPDKPGIHVLTIRAQDNSGNIFTQAATLSIIEGFPLTVTVTDAADRPVSGAWVQVYTATGVAYDFKTTNSSGSVVFKVPRGSYRVQADYSTTYLFTPFSTSTSAQTQSVAAPMSVSLTLSDYPLPLASTTLFWIILWTLIAVLATVAVIVSVKRRHSISTGLRAIPSSLTSAVAKVRKEKPPSGAKYCIYCGTALKSGATVCGNCGRIIPVMRL